MIRTSLRGGNLSAGVWVKAVDCIWGEFRGVEKLWGYDQILSDEPKLTALEAEELQLL